jgi:transposase
MADRIEVVDVRRRRRWSVEEKLDILAECDLPGVSAGDVARRHDLSTGLLYTWRRMAEGRPARSAAPVALLPVHVAEPPPAPKTRPPRAARMEIGLPGGIKLRVDAGIDPEALAAVVAALQRR